MAIFTALATFLLSGTFLAGSALAVPLLATGLAVATTIGLNYVVKALSGTQQDASQQGPGGVQGTLQAGGDIARAFGVGYHITAGSLVYANTWGTNWNPGSGGSSGSQTPNAYLTQVIALSDLPHEQLLNVWVNGELGSLNAGAADGNLGTPVTQYDKGGQHHCWIKYYNGTQTGADPFLVAQVASIDRPYAADRIGTGVCYAICTTLVEDTLFTGFPTFKFELSGVPLYDPTKDSTNGGSGSHRYSDPSTWGGDGDQLPAVQIYNILRGVHYNGAWLYGLQGAVGQARLPAANWNAQIAKCRAPITGVSGLEPTYRAGGQINIDSQPAAAIEALLSACQGRLSEIGGFYKIHLGSPDSSVFSWTDADLLSSEEQTYRPFFGLADSVNGIQATYPDPAQGWNTATAPALYRTDLEVRDGNRRLMANPALDFVPYAAQVQRLQKSGIEEGQRARTHVLPFPPSYWIIEPGDVGAWTSVRNGYSAKLFRVDGVTDRANLDIFANVTEVDPSDYSWDHNTDFTGVAIGPTVFPRVPAQGVIDWTAEGTVLYDQDGLGRHPAIRITWDNTLAGIIGVQYEIQLSFDLSDVGKGRTDQYKAGALIISQGLIQLTTYQIRMQYIPSSPRDMLWSDWITVTTPDVVSADIPQWIAAQVTTVMDYLNDRLAEVEQRLSTVTATNGQRNWLDTKEIRSQLSSRSDAAFAEIKRVETVSTDAETALASDIETLTTTVGDNSAAITVNATAIATLNNQAAAQYAVTLDVNGYATGFNLINGGSGVSSATFTTDKFQIASPGVSGGSPVPIFTVANVGGSPKVALRGDMYIDGSIAATKIVTNSLTANQIAANTIDATRIVTGTITSDSGVIGALAVKSLSIQDNAVTVPVAQSFSFSFTSTGAVTAASFNLSIDTTGLGGKAIGVYAISSMVLTNFGTSNAVNTTLQMNGSNVIGWTSSVAIATLSWKQDFTATGGVMNIPIALVTNVAAATGVQTVPCTGSLFAIACKR